MLRMEEVALRFAKISKAELIYQGITQRPIVADVPLLKTLFGDSSETWHIGAAGLEPRKRIKLIGIVKIVVSAKVLLVIDAMVKLKRDLIGALPRNRCSLKESVSSVRQRHELIH